MYYPWLDVPIFTSTALASVAALAFVLIALCSVGDALLLALENGRSVRADDTKYRVYLKKHARTFAATLVPLTTFSGLGAWSLAGLTAPLATQESARLFIFGWGSAWALYLLQLVCAFAFYYCWDKLTPRASRVIGWVCALTTWLLLVLFSGFTSFMLNSAGVVADWESTGVFWHALLNVQFLPLTVVRTGGALLIGAVYFICHVSYCEKDLNFRERVSKRMRFPAFLGLFMLLAGVVGWWFFLPETSRLTFESSAATNLGVAVLLASVFATILMLIVGPCSRPREVAGGQALATLLLALVGVGATERYNAVVRNPYGVDRVVYANELYRRDVRETRQTGLLYKGTWTTYALEELQEEYPELKISAQNYLGVESIHLEPPVVPEPEPDEEEAPEEEGEGGDEESLLEDTTDELSSVDVSVAYFARTAAQRQLADQSGFAPTSTNTGALQSSQNALSGQSSALSPAAASQNGLATRAGAQSGVGNANLAPSRAGAQPQTLAQPQVVGQTPQSAAQPQSVGLTQSGRQPQAQREVSALGSPAATNVSGAAIPAAQPAAAGASLNRAPAAASPSVAPQTTTTPTPGVATPNPAIPQTPTADRPATRPNAAPIGAAQTSSAALPATAPAAPATSATSAGLVDDPLVGAASTTSDDLTESGEEENDEPLSRALPEELDLDVNGPIARGNEDLLQVDHKDQIWLGRMVFMHHCNSCHAAAHGCRAVGPLVGGRSVDELKEFALRLNYARFDMPPWAGTEVEAELLAEYLDSIAPKIPDDAFMKDKPKKERKAKPAKAKKAKAEEDESADADETSEDAQETTDGAEDLVDPDSDSLL